MATEESSAKRRASWKKYDAKRKGTPERLLKERARNWMRNVKKSGLCSRCKVLASTVWHHADYTKPDVAVELCHKCHRGEHPR